MSARRTRGGDLKDSKEKEEAGVMAEARAMPDSEKKAEDEAGKRSPDVTLDAESWSAGYKAGHAGALHDAPPSVVDGLAWSSGFIEGQADRQAGKVRPAVRKPPA